MTKNKIKQKNTITSETEVGINYIKIVIILAIIFALFYIITYFVTKPKEKESIEPTIQYKEILAGNLLGINQNEYYVLVEMEGNKYNGLYDSYLLKYSSLENSLNYYVVDLSNGFNSKYISEEFSLDVENVSDLKFNSTTLLKIKKGKIDKAYFTDEMILEQLKKLLK